MARRPILSVDHMARLRARADMMAGVIAEARLECIECGARWTEFSKGVFPVTFPCPVCKQPATGLRHDAVTIVDPVEETLPC